MPINFVTGLPRQGKTLFTFMQVMERAKKENRPVFYCNIPEVTIEGWTEIDHPDKWMDCPNDSIIIVDELQDFWGAENGASRVPLPILELSKHGKRGIDFYFITQDPTLVHNTPRKLAEWHWYVVRAFGTESALAYKFKKMRTDPSREISKADKYPWRYPKEAFGKKDKAGNWITRPWYKSADVHNIKREIPLKLWAIPLGIAIAIGAGWFAISSVLSYGTKIAGVATSTVPGAAAAAGKGAQPPSVSAPGAGGVGASGSSPMTAQQYVDSRTPRLADFPHSAPVYDSVTQPTDAPYPAACVQMGKTCKCYTQQATLLQVSGAVCLQIVQHGFFMDWKTASKGEFSARDRGDYRPHREGPPQGQQVAQIDPVRTVPAPMPAARPEPPQNHYLQGLAARNAQVRSSLQ